MRDTGQVPSATTPWGLVVPVKRLPLAKTRLGPPDGRYDQAARQALALAFASDVVTAGLRCPVVASVVVVTDDERAAATLAALGAQVVSDLPDAGHTAALEHGAAFARAQFPLAGVAAVSADLPCLTAELLAAALALVADRAFAADTSGLGTTLLAAGPGARLAPAYGPGSAERHRRSGALELIVAAAMRLDVDTPADLSLALALGVGPATAAVVAGLAASAA